MFCLCFLVRRVVFYICHRHQQFLFHARGFFLSLPHFFLRQLIDCFANEAFCPVFSPTSSFWIIFTSCKLVDIFCCFSNFCCSLFFYFHLWSPGTSILFSGKFAFLSILSSNVLFFLDMVSLFSCSIFFLDFSDKYPYLWTPHFFYS